MMGDRIAARHGIPPVQGGLVVAHHGMRFLADANGVLFPRQWLTAQLSETIIAEQGIVTSMAFKVYVGA